jgi:4-amino-4-deoxy-L-arabinose transferase-like glycosyltransferase
VYTLPTHTGFQAWVALVLTVLMLGAFLLRCQAVWQRIPESPDELAMHLVGDESGYEELAYALLHGSFFQSPVRVPVYPMFIAGVYSALGQRSPAKLLYVQAFIGVLVVPLTYLLARRLTGITPALVATGIVAFDGALIDHAPYIYAEILYTPLLLVALLALLWALQAPRRWRFAVAGASMAVVTLGRPTSAMLLVILPLLLPWDWRLKQKAGICMVYGLTMMAVIAPWTYHNWRTFHRFLPLAISAGALWQGSPEFYHLTHRRPDMVDIWANELNPQRNGGYDPHTIAGDRYFTRRGIQSIRAEPMVYVIYSLQKLAHFWVGWGYWEMYDWHMRRSWFSYPPLKLLGILVARQLPIVALVALVFLAVRGRLRLLLPFIAICAYFTLVHMITWAEVRYSEPLHPLLAIIVVTAARQGFALFKQKRGEVSLQMPRQRVR